VAALLGQERAFAYGGVGRPPAGRGYWRVRGSGPSVWCVEAQDPHRSRPASVKGVRHSVGSRDERPWADGLCRTGERRLNGSVENQERVDLAALIA
jgi:hypothetical protein